jgi:hypothetical protein
VKLEVFFSAISVCSMLAVRTERITLNARIIRRT